MSIGQKAVRSAAWSIITSVVSRGLGLVGTLILTRWIAPADYGEVSAASVAVLSANQFSTLGVGLYIVANPKAGRDVSFHATVMHLSLGVVALVGVVLLRHPLGPMFDAPQLYQFVPGLALALLMDRIAFMPERILVRQMRFGLISIERTFGEFAYTGVSLVMAWKHYGAMSIVYGNLARSFLRSAIILFTADRREWLEWHPIKAKTLDVMARYGGAVSAGGLASFASRRWDNLLISRMFGTGTMGAYNMAYNLADVPASQIGEQITDVLMASFPHIAEPERQRDALLRATRILALIMFPLAIGLGAVAHSIGDAFFDARWAEVGTMLLFLSALSIPRPIGGAITAYLHARNRPGVVAAIEWINLAIVLGGIATMGRLGPIWACSAVGVAFGIRALTSMYAVMKIDGIPVRTFLVGLLPPLWACLVMSAAIVGVRFGMRALGWYAPMARLLLQTSIGGIAYIAGALLFARPVSMELVDLARRAVGRRKKSVEAPARAAEQP